MAPGPSPSPLLLLHLGWEEHRVGNIGLIHCIIFLLLELRTFEPQFPSGHEVGRQQDTGVRSVASQGMAHDLGESFHPVDLGLLTSKMGQ